MFLLETLSSILWTLGQTVIPSTTTPFPLGLFEKYLLGNHEDLNTKQKIIHKHNERV